MYFLNIPLWVLVFFLSTNSLFGQFYPGKMMDEALKEKANAVILKDFKKVHLKSAGQYEMEVEKAITLLNKKASHLFKFQVLYKEGTEFVDQIEIQIYNQNGFLIQKIKPKEIEDYIAYDGISLITDQRIKHWQSTPSSYPITISYKYTKKSKNTLLLPTWQPIFEENVAVLESEYILHSDIPVRTKEMNLSHFPSIDAKPNHFKMVNQKAIRMEPFSPPSLHLLPYVFFSPEQYQFEGYKGQNTNWDEFGQWMYNSFLDKKEVLDPIKIKQEFATIISTDDSPRTIAKKLYKYVQENTRYVLISLDEGGLNPLSAKKVHEVKYGDCKALTFYMKSLLEVYDIPADYAILHAGSEDPIDMFKDFPNTIPGNHAILHIPLENESIWLDCTSNDNPFNHLGTFSDNRNAVLINKDKSTFIRTPRLSSDQNKMVEEIKLDLSTPDQEILVDIKQKHFGNFMDKILYLKNKSDIEYSKYLKKENFSHLNNFTLKKRNTQYEEAKRITIEKLTFSFSDYIEHGGIYQFIPISLQAFDIPFLPKIKERKYPIFFPRDYQYESTTTLTVPIGYQLLDPPNQTLKTAYGTYHIEVNQTADNQIIIQRKFIALGGTFPHDKYQEIKLFLDQALKIERGQLMIQKKP